MKKVGGRFRFRFGVYTCARSATVLFPCHIVWCGCQSTRHTVNSSQPKIVWRVDRRLKRRAVTAVTSWPHVAVGADSSALFNSPYTPYTYDIMPLSMERIRRWRRIWDDSFRRVSYTSSNSVSVPSSCSSRYMLSCPQLALWFRRRCQPSTSSLDRTLRLNTDHDEGGHVLESIHVDQM